MTTRALNALLSALGLMRVSEHEELIENSVSFHLRNYRSLERHRDDLKAEVAKLRDRDTAQTDRIAQLKTWSRRDSEAIIEQGLELAAMSEEIEALRPDALLGRAARQKRRKSPQPDSLGKSPAEGVS